MVAITDKFGKASIDTDYAVATTVKTTRVIGGTVLECFDLSKFADDTPVYFITYKKTTNPITGEASVTNQISWKAIVNTGANTLTNLTLAPGYTDTGNAIGDFVECILTSHWGNQMVDGLLVAHDQDGTLKAGAVDVAAVLADKVATLAKINGGATAGVLKTDASGNVSTGAKTTDANGWTVFDHGGWKQYTKRVTFSQSIAAGSTGLNLTVSSNNLPSGISTLGTNSIQARPVFSGDAALHTINPEMTSSSTTLNFAIRNAHTSTLTAAGFIDVEITG